MLICGICKRQFKDNYCGGLRNSTTWKDKIICSKCYNLGHENLGQETK